MKKFLLVVSALTASFAAVAVAQNASATNNQLMGRGRGGAPYAWNDKDKNGKCDLTGAPVGQGRGIGAMRCGRRGRGMRAGGRGRGMGRGMGWWGMGQGAAVQQQQSAPAPAGK